MNAATIESLRLSGAMQRERQAIVTAGLDSLNRLVPIALRDTGQSGVVGRFLLGLYNGRDYRFDLTHLRGLDTSVFVDCMNVLLMDNQPEIEVHLRVANGEAIWQRLKEKWASKGLVAL